MRITIITATYNSEATIADAIYSVTSQSYSDIEHLIIDGDSTDKTLEVINSTKNRVTKIISEPDKGIYDALNKGIENATGEIIAFLHADDIYASSNSVEAIIETLKTNKTDAAYADLQYISKNNTNTIIRHWTSGAFAYSKLKKGWMPPHPTFFVKKSIYQKYGKFDTSFKIAADYDTVLRFLGKEKISVAYYPQVLVKMKLGGESNKNISNILKKMKEDVRALRKNKMGGWHTVFMKNITKIPQLFKK